MRATISILLGSGFSIPEGLPSLKQLNERLSKINEEEILIHTDLTAMFLNGQKDLNRWCRWDERLFVQEFLKYYNSKILKQGEDFNYEVFYDFYALYLFDRQNHDEIETFYNEFAKHLNGKDNRDCYNRVSDFNRSFNQLLAQLLHKPKYLENVTYGNYPPYDAFWGYIRELLKTYDVKVHTLNHDLFFDCIGQNHTDLFQYFSDGYQLEGSPFYGILTHIFNRGTPDEIHKTFHVKLEHFVDKFDTPLCYYKLHGSIFNTIVYPLVMGVAQNPVRIKNNYGISQFVMEDINEETGLPIFAGIHNDVSPDFLSGTTNKMRYYTKDAYYEKLLTHFQINLSNSEQLVVIGYGFQDSGINEFFEKEFLSKKRKMIVIDPNKPKTNLIDKYQANYIPKGVTDVTYAEYLEFSSPTSLNIALL